MSQDMAKGIILTIVFIGIIFITAVTAYDNGKFYVYKDMENFGCEKMIKLHNEKKG